jgi:hypothetical protein
MIGETGFDFVHDPGSCLLAVRTVLEEGRFVYRTRTISARDPDRDPFVRHGSRVIPREGCRPMRLRSWMPY